MWVGGVVNQSSSSSQRDGSGRNLLAKIPRNEFSLHIFEGLFQLLWTFNHLTTYSTSCSMWSVTTKSDSLALANNNNKQRVTLFVNPSILKQARAQAVVEERTLTSLVEKALIEYLPRETVIKKVILRVDSDP